MTLTNSQSQNFNIPNQQGIALATPDPMAQFVAICRNVGMWFCSLFSTSIEVLLRQNMGERYLSPVPIGFMMVVFFFGYLFFGAGLASMAFEAVVIVAWFVQYGVIVYHSRRNDFPHSRTPGKSSIPLHEARMRMGGPRPFMDNITQRVVEPFLVISLSHFVGDRFLGVWLVAAALALTLRESIAYRMARDKYLDGKDKEKEARVIVNMFKTGFLVEGAKPKNSYSGEGFTVQIAAPLNTPQEQAAAFRNLAAQYPAELQQARAELEAERGAEAAAGSEWADFKAKQAAATPAPESADD